MTLVSVTAERCKTHLDCLQACPVNAIDIVDGVAVIQENCIGCDACIKACPEKAIVRTAGEVQTSSSAIAVVLPAGSASGRALDAALRAGETTGTGVLRLPFDGGPMRSAAQDLADRASGAALVVLPAFAPFDELAGALGRRLEATVFCNVEALTRFADGRTAVEIETHGGRGYATFDVPSGERLVVTVRSTREALVVLGDDERLHAAALALSGALGARSCSANDLPGDAPRLLVIAGPSGELPLAALAGRARGTVGFGIPPEHPVAAACDALFCNDPIEAMRAFAAAVP